MSENQNPEIDTTETDEVEGHVSSNRGATSGRGVSSGRFRPDEDEMFGEDVQGHGTVRGGLVEDEDDTEGHSVRGQG